MSKSIEGIVVKFRNRKAQVAIIGLGYVGLPLAVAMAEAGFQVVGIDKDDERIASLKSGESSTSDVSSVRLRDATKSGSLELFRDFAQVENSKAIIMCVPSPLTRHLEPDTSYIVAATESIVPHLRKGQLIVLESTSYPGTTEELVKPRIEARGFEIGKDIYLAFSPERVDPGNKGYTLQAVPKVVGGVTENCTEVVKALYEQVIEAGVHAVSSPRAAEMEKLLENIFRNVNIALVNELTQLCDRMNIDIWEVIEAAKTKPYGFMPFYPGPGVGGHCIPIDPFYLSWKAREYDLTTRFIELAGQINDAMPYHVVEQAMKLLNEEGKALRGSKVMLLGMAYKRDIDDLRESPALKVARLLADRGAMLSYHDPYISEINSAGLELRDVVLTPKLLAGQDLVIITTAHTNVDYKEVVGHAPLILDTRNATKGIESRKIARLGVGR
jgi:UDP-N-acetyl-D-glucosamine dehydrogenase